MSPKFGTPKQTDSSGTGYARLRLLVILSVCLIIAASTAYTTWKSYRSRQIILKAAELQTQAYARSLKEHTERTFSEIDFILKAKSRQIQLSADLSREQLTKLLYEDTQNIPQISSLLFADPSGRVTAISLQNTQPLNIQDRLYYRHHLHDSSDTLFITPPFRSKISGHWRISLSRRINNSSGGFAGILVATLDISYFEKLYADLASDRNARYSLALMSGSYLMLVPDPANVYESGKKMSTAQIQRYSGEPFGTYQPEQSNVFGQPRITSWHRLDRYPAVAIMSFNKDHVLADWQSTFTKDIITYAAFILLIAALTRLLINQIRSIELANSMLIQKNEELSSARERADISREEAEAATMAKSAFLANMSHEIRSPMNAIIWLAQIALETDLTERQHGYLSKLLIAARSLLRIINDILDLSKIEANRLELLQEPFSLKEVLQQVSDLFQLSIETKKLAFVVDIDPNLPARVVGDSLRLGQVLNNLVGNAVKFTEAGGIIVKVRQEERLDTMVSICFSVTDTGIGISPDQAGQLFQPFSQADNSIARRFGGTGLGLSISRQLVNLMGGTITLSSSKGKGSCFSFTIRLLVQDETDRQQPAEQPVSAYERARPMHGAEILLVEDNEVNRYAVQEFLERSGLVITAVTHGGEALQILQKQRFDAVLMDMQMPEMDGAQATSLIRRLPNGAEIPIIAMTGAASESDRESCIAAGMNDHIGKPINAVELLQKLLHWLGKPAAE
jgi:signal transduction histidine kinase/ActR/RegA family two-component response regulator